MLFMSLTMRRTVLQCSRQIRWTSDATPCYRLGLRLFFFFSSRRRHTRFDCDWSSDVCSSDLKEDIARVATISSREREIGDVIANAIEKVGKDGVVNVEEGQTLGLELEFTEDRKSVV